MINAHSIPVAEMAQHLAAGDAQALLPDGVAGPVRLRGLWWAVSAGHDRYRPVSDPAVLTVFETGLARLAAHRQHRADILAETGARRR